MRPFLTWTVAERGSVSVNTFRLRRITRRLWRETGAGNKSRGGEREVLLRQRPAGRVAVATAGGQPQGHRRQQRGLQPRTRLRGGDRAREELEGRRGHEARSAGDVTVSRFDTPAPAHRGVDVPVRDRPPSAGAPGAPWRG